MVHQTLGCKCQAQHLHMLCTSEWMMSCCASKFCLVHCKRFVLRCKPWETIISRLLLCSGGEQYYPHACDAFCSGVCKCMSEWLTNSCCASLCSTKCLMSCNWFPKPNCQVPDEEAYQVQAIKAHCIAGQTITMCVCAGSLICAAVCKPLDAAAQQSMVR